MGTIDLERMKTIQCMLLALSASLGLALKQGIYGGQHWQLTMNDDQLTGTLEGDCSKGTVGSMAHSEYKANVGTYVNFTVSLTLQFNNAKKTMQVTNAQLDKMNATLTGKFVTGTGAGSYSENFRVVHLAPADLFKCINSGNSIKASWFTILLALATVVLQAT